MKISRYAKLGTASLLAGGLCSFAAGQEPNENPVAPPAAATQEAASDQAPQNPSPQPALPDANNPERPAPADKTNDADVNRSSDRPADQNAAPTQPDSEAVNGTRRSDTERRDDGSSQNNRREMQGSRYNTANLGITFNSATAGALTINDIGGQGYFRDVGFRRGDRIVSAGGRQFNDPYAFYGWLGTVRPGTRIPIVILRGGQQTTVYWTPTAEFVQQYTLAAPSESPNFYGIHIDNQAQDAVIVAQVDPDSPAEHAGIRVHDMIVAVNNQEVRNPREFADATAMVPQGQMATLAVSRTFDVQINPSTRAIEQRTSLPPVPAATVEPATNPQPAVRVQTPARQYPVPAQRRGIFRRN